MAELRRTSGAGGRFVVVGVLCAALGAVAGGIHASTDSSTSSSTAAAGQEPREPSRQELTLLHDAGQILLRDCMQQKGFKYQPVKENPVPEAREFPYVLDDVAWAREHGYGTDIQQELSELRTTDVNQRYFRGLPAKRRAAALTAANGSRPLTVSAKAPDGMVFQRSPKGCQSEADAALYGNLRQWFQAKVTADALTELRRAGVTADPRFAEAVKPWSACMRAADHPATSPADLRTATGARKSPLPRTEEIALAVTEARCAHTSGLAKTARALDRQYARSLARQYHAAVRTYRELQLNALPGARALIQKAGASS
ncbi:hypothetical protein ACIHIX_25370 [Streptomyces sp. NPDC051913]|uniref:hypothetical protein n=1 Tax=Streptomyces sp. NPDC051913 TaxID=3365676 RepID=UPI0037D6A8A1